MLGVLAIQDREIALIAEQLRVLPQDPVADRVKRAAPQRRQFLSQQIRHPPHHLPGRLVRERQQQNAVRRNPLLQQIGHPVGQRARLARARPGDHQRRPRRRRHRRVLLRVQFARIINLQVDRRAKGVQNIITRHHSTVTGYFPMSNHDSKGSRTSRAASSSAGSAGFQTCCIADFQVGWRLECPHAAGLETCDTADLEVCATRLAGWTPSFGLRSQLPVATGGPGAVGGFWPAVSDH